MSWRYTYTPYIWPAIASAAFIAALAAYAWRHRSVPGGRSFAVMWWFVVPCVAGDALVLAAADAQVKIFWFKFRMMWVLPMFTAGLWFVLDYANLTRWLNRRTLVLLSVVPLLGVLGILTNQAHHLVWTGFSVEPFVHPQYGLAGWALAAYCYALMAGMTLVFLWLFVWSPLHRRAVALCLCGQLAVRLSTILNRFDWNPIAPMDPTAVVAALNAAVYALAVFRFRMFDLIPIARGTVIEQMRDGVVVLDTRDCILDLNPTAARILGLNLPRARGSALAEVLTVSPDQPSGIIARVGHQTRHYVPQRSVLKDRHGLPMGEFLMLHDVTEQKQAEQKLLEQQRAIATMHERERLARELHDSLGQVLGYVKMQGHVARGFVAQGDSIRADACLAQLVAAAESAHEDVRYYILGARTGSSAGAAFQPLLEDYLRRFTEASGISARLTVPPELEGSVFEPMVETQLLRIIQEALTNVRKHARASTVEICLALNDGLVQAVIEDDGAGFEPALVEAAPGRGFGLSVMHERAEEVGGAVKVESSPGLGTKVVICVPLGEGAA